MFKFLIPIFIVLAGLNMTCNKVEEDNFIPTDSLIDIIDTLPSLASHHFIIIMDGARYSETFGDATFSNIPKLKLLSQQGSLCANFYNNGNTLTQNGISAILIGNYNSIANNSSGIPPYSSFLNVFLDSKSDTNLAFIISSKDKIAALGNYVDNTFPNQHTPYINCGINGLFSGYRQDSITYKIAIDHINNHNPMLGLLSFKEPDYSGHTGVWADYINGIKTTDSLIYEFINFVEANPIYNNKTNYYIANDHGRHLNNVSDGFKSHGDDCEGCKHVSLLCIGPDFKKNYISSLPFEQLDISKTIAAMLKLNLPHCKGKILNDILK
jgi:hypothetical protein